MSTKELVNTEDSFEYDYTNIKTKGNFCGSKLTFEEYEKENDMYNNDISPNFLELSIKWIKWNQKIKIYLFSSNIEIILSFWKF